MLDCNSTLPSAKAVWVVLGVWGVGGWLCFVVGQFWPLCRQFGWFLGFRGVGWRLFFIVGQFRPLLRLFEWF